LQQTRKHLAMKPIDIYLITDGDATFQRGLELAGILRNSITGLSVLQNCSGGSVKNQMKKADKSGAQLAFLLGEQELEMNTIAVKSLRKDVPQLILKQEELVTYLLKRNAKTI